MSDDVAILVPALRRPHRVRPLLESIFSTTPAASVHFVCDSDDADEQDAVHDCFGDFTVGVRCHALASGGYAAKINHGVRITREPLIFLAADDLEFHPGWFDAARARMRGRVGVVGTNDLGNKQVMRGEHATHLLVSREYAELGTVDDPSQLLHEGYEHNWVDNEFVETAKSRGSWAFASDAIVEHLHPLWGKGDQDEVYERGQSAFHRDKRRFLKRRRLWT